MPGTGRFPGPSLTHEFGYCSCLLLMRRRAGAGVPSNYQSDGDGFPQSSQILTRGFGRQFKRIAPQRRYRHRVGYLIDDPTELKGAVGQQVELVSRNRDGEGVNPQCHLLGDRVNPGAVPTEGESITQSEGRRCPCLGFEGRRGCREWDR